MNQVTVISLPADPLERVSQIVECMRKFRLDIERALVYDGGAYTFDHVCARVLSGDLDMYELPNSVLLCETFDAPNLRSYHVYIAAGDLDEIIEFQRDQLVKEARMRRCSKLSFGGREGWKRALKDEGWKPIRITMMKDV